MCRYFFHIVDLRTNNLVKDIEGAFCTDLTQAKREAIALAKDIVGHRLHGSWWEVLVSDDTGNVLVSIPLGEVRASVFRNWRALVHRMATYEPQLRPRIFTFLLTFAIIATIVQSAILTDTIPLAPRSSHAGLTFDVRFASHASVSDINRFLLARNATVIDGPRYDGSYRLRFFGKAPQHSQVSKFAEQITSEKTVVFAEAVQ